MNTPSLCREGQKAPAFWGGYLWLNQAEHRNSAVEPDPPRNCLRQFRPSLFREGLGCVAALPLYPLPSLPHQPIGSLMPEHDRRPNNRRNNPFANIADPVGTATRRAALKMLDAVLRRGEALDRAQHAATQGIKNPADRAHAVVIAAEPLRHLPDLDALIDSATKQRIPDDAKSRAVLRLALVQALKLETPPHAAIATALPLIEGGPKRLVHGVFGTLMRSEAKLPDLPTLPEDAAERWQDQWGDDMVEAAQVAISAQPPLDLSLRDTAETSTWADTLGGTSLGDGNVRISEPGNVTALPGYDEGAWWVQDISASIAARLLGQGDGRTVLDLCAAPGGKTMQLAANDWNVNAVDISAKRLERLKDNLSRTGLSVDLTQGDIEKWSPDAPADAVLLDAPCSATGIFRRHPDVLHRVGNRQIAELAELQEKLLDRAAEWVKPGGTLVYATCSLEQTEGEEQITAFLAAHPDWQRAAVQPDELPAGFAPNADGDVRILPGTLADAGGADGFFISRLRKNA